MIKVYKAHKGPGKSLKELMSFQEKTACFAIADCIGAGEETCSWSIKEGQGDSTSSEIRQTMNAKPVWKYLL